MPDAFISAYRFDKIQNSLNMITNKIAIKKEEPKQIYED